MFTKRLVIVSWAVALTLTVLAIVLSPAEWVPVVLPLSWAEVTAVNAFYLWKAKNENRAKYAQQFIRELSEEHGVDYAIRVAEIVLKD